MRTVCFLTEAKRGQTAAATERGQSGLPDAATELATEAKRGQPATSSLQQAATEANRDPSKSLNGVLIVP